MLRCTPAVTTRLCLLLALLVPWVATTTAAAQTIEAAILGRVHDQTGAALDDAQIIARNSETGGEWRIRTRRDGAFAFLHLPLGGP